MQDAIRQGKILSFSLMKRKESLQEIEEEGRKREGGGGGGWREMVFDLFFKGIINSLSALVCNLQSVSLSYLPNALICYSVITGIW